MELADAIRLRRSIRKFKPDPVPENLVSELLEAARLAPSSTNTQPWRFAVVKDPEMRRRLQESSPWFKFVAGAPVVFVALADWRSLNTRRERLGELGGMGAFEGTDLAKPPIVEAYLSTPPHLTTPTIGDPLARLHLYLNVAIAVEHLVLRATDLGLGSCWMRRFDEDKVRSVLAVPDHFSVVALVPVGYPGQQPPARPRLPLGEIVWRTF